MKYKDKSLTCDMATTWQDDLAGNFSGKTKIDKIL